MEFKRDFFRNQTPRNLFLLLLIFIFGIGSQALLNLSLGNVISELDDKTRNAQIENIIGQEIILEIHKIESDFFQFATFPNRHFRKILLEDIKEQKEEIIHALEILNHGGVYKHKIDLNLPNTPEKYEVLRYAPEIINRYRFSETELIPKFKIINEKSAELNQRLDYIDYLREIESPELFAVLDELKLQVKMFKPLFNRIKEDANHIFYENKENLQKTQKFAEAKKAQYRNLQISLTISVIILALIAFYTLSRNIRNTTSEIESGRDYAHDILESQSNIIIINDGSQIIDVSGGFFKFFSNYESLDDFSHDYACICDLFVEEEGYIYKFKDKSWIEYLVQNPKKNHKVKLNYLGETTIFQINAIKSEKYQRFIISMFDITENEKITADLKEQKNKALEATQAKSSFLANMSHEIRTPLNAILGFISLLKAKKHDTETQKYLETIDSSSHSLLGIINDILDFSKIESGKLNIDPTDFNPRKELLSSADLFRARCSEKNITFHINVDERVPNGIRSDALRIKQVISNLISNAIKFTGQNKNVYLYIDYEDGLLKCRVKDEGIGISPEALENIFDAFSQAESSTTRKYGGTGLGLTISSKLVDMLGGKLNVTSVVGEGSIFCFAIPVEEVTLKSVDTVIQQQEVKNYDSKVLLVEDNKTNQMLMSAILRKQNIEFDLAEDGQQAVDAVQNSEYALVLMDENMPNMNGIEATRVIRDREQAYNLSRLPIIALTANAMTGDRDRFIAAGMDEYLTKPVNIPKLIEVLQQFMPTKP